MDRDEFERAAARLRQRSVQDLADFISRLLTGGKARGKARGTGTVLEE